MERLTEHHVNKTLGAYMVCSGACIKEDFDCTLCENLNKIVNTLAAYEDTGLEPEEVVQTKLALIGKALAEIKEIEGITTNRIIELARAEKDGRLVVLPCKLHESIFYLEDGDWYDDVPCGVYFGQKQGEWNDSLLYECEDGFSFYAEEVGETVFLTREEAEAALKKREATNETD